MVGAADWRTAEPADNWKSVSVFFTALVKG
jgi:hypothetical protein